MTTRNFQELKRERDAVEGFVKAWRTQYGTAFESAASLIIQHYDAALKELEFLIEHLEEGGET